MGQHVRKELDAAGARSGGGTIVVRAEVERQRACRPDALLERRHQRPSHSPATGVRSHHQGMELPGVTVSWDGANPAEDLVPRSRDEADAVWSPALP